MVDSRFGFGFGFDSEDLIHRLTTTGTLSMCQVIEPEQEIRLLVRSAGRLSGALSAPAGPQHELLRDDAQPHDFDMARWACGTAPLTGRPGHRRRGSSRQRQ